MVSTKHHMLSTSAVLILLIAKEAVCLNNGLALTPGMGWNTWNKFGCNISEEIVKSNARRLLDLGLDKIGYRYVNLDDCWLLPGRNSNSHVIVDPIKFPKGMTELGNYIHSLGLKFGIYNSAGTMTCERRAGSLTYE